MDRWQALFTDLSAELDAAQRAELDDEIGERTSIELAKVPLVDRLRAATGAVRLDLRGGGHAAGTVGRAGADWVLLTGSAGDVVVRLAAVVLVTGAGAHARQPTEVEARTSVRSPLRQWARDRSGVRVTTTGGAVLRGRIDRVGADHLDLVDDEHRAVTLPFRAIAAVRR